MVRVYGWSKTADHTAFLDAAHANGLKVMATFYMVRRALATREPASATPRAAPIPTSAPAGRRAARQSRRCTPRSSGTRSSPRSPRRSASCATNPPCSSGALATSSTACGTATCSSSATPSATHARGTTGTTTRGCWHTGTAPTPSSPCYASSACVYSRLFKFINDAADAAKEASARARARARDPQPPRSAPSGSPLVALLSRPWPTKIARRLATGGRRARRLWDGRR